MKELKDIGSEEITIRPMTEEDLEQVETIERESFSVPWSFDAFKSAMALPHTIYLVACAGREILGYCGMYISLDEGEIPNVAVRPDARNRRVGERMLSELLRRGADRGVASVFLEVRAGNEPARKLYARLGFEAAGVRKNFYEKPVEDAVIMWKK